MPPTPTPASDELRATAAFYDETAARYDADVDGESTNAMLRDAFRARVSSIAGPATRILDFGCGTGTDAAWYAVRGHAVIAYDVSRGMVDRLRRRCSREIADGRVTPIAGDLSLLLQELERSGPVAVVASNFAVLNHVRDLRPWLDALAPHMEQDAAIVASMLNPFYWRDMTQLWWWRGMPRSLRTGAIRVAGKVTTYRHYVRTVRAMASPSFELVESVGALDDNFLFLILRKCR